MRLIDTHTHIYSEEFDEDRDQVLSRAEQAGLEAMILPNVDVESYPRMMSLARSYAGRLYPSVGLHPTSVREDYESQLKYLEGELAKHRFVAIGEIGLDYYWDETFKSQQIDAFERQIHWATNHSLPVIIHSRSAWQDTLVSLDRAGGLSVRGVFHSFIGEAKEIQEALAFDNMMIGIGGVVTFKNSTLREYIGAIPLDRLLVETDAPYLSPVPKRGRRNEPAYLTYTLEHIARIYGIDVNKLAMITTENARRLFSV